MTTPAVGKEASWKVPVKRMSTHVPLPAMVVWETVPETAVHVVPPCCSVMLLNAMVIVCVVLLQMRTSISNFLDGGAACLHTVEMVAVVAGLDDAKAGVAMAIVTTGTDHAAAPATDRRETALRVLEDKFRLPESTATLRPSAAPPTVFSTPPTGGKVDLT